MSTATTLRQRLLQSEPELLKLGVTRLIEKGNTAWSLAEVHNIYPDEIEVIYYTTP
jgi:hypothetical protein